MTRNGFIWFSMGLCFVLPMMLVVIPYSFVDSNLFKITWLTFAPVVYLVSFVTCGGLISRIGLKHLKPGRFKRTLDDKDYFFRRIHATPWTSLYYFTPIYFLTLSIMPLRRLAFRLFGYKGNLDFVVYPDTWLRDLPVLDIGKGAYLSNKSSIATNICLMDDTILVDSIRIGAKACVGHGTLIGPGTRLEDEVELGANITSGIRVKYGRGAKVYEMCGIQHGVVVGAGAVIEGGAILGLRSKIGDGVRIKEGSHIHTGTRVLTQEDADRLYSEETGTLTKRRLDRGQDLIRNMTSSDHRPAEDIVGVGKFSIKSIKNAED